MRIIPIIILITVFDCQNFETKKKLNGEITRTVHVKNNLNELIPQRVNDYLKNYFPDWVIPDTSDYNRIWWDFNDKDLVPYYVTADINDDNLSDYVFILKNLNSIRLVFIIDLGKTLTHWIDNDFIVTYKGNVKDIQYGLNIIPPGQIDCIIKSEETSTILKSNGIVLLRFEFKSRVYYWSDGRIKVIPINEDQYFNS